jgi:hypothetical protein
MANMMRILRAIEEDTSHIEQGKKEWKEHVLVQKEYMLVLKGFNKWGKKGRYLKTLSHGACDTNKMELSFSVLCFPVATHGHLTSIRTKTSLIDIDSMIFRDFFKNSN